MNKIKNLLLIILGITLCIIPITLSPVLYFLKNESNRPWNDGLIKNTLRAYLRYNAVSWIRRMISICKNPKLTVQYINILLTKKKYDYSATVFVSVKDLIPQHDVQTDHWHHRSRVFFYQMGMANQVTSFSPIIVSKRNGKLYIEDGHHRIAAMKEAGIEETPALVFYQS